MDNNNCVDLKDRIELLLKIMTNGTDSSNSVDSDYFISSDESDTDPEEDSLICPEANEPEQNSDIKFLLNKFFDDHVNETEKRLPSNVGCDATNDVQFEEKMYRVIPLKIDKRISKLKDAVVLDKKRYFKSARERR